MSAVPSRDQRQPRCAGYPSDSPSVKASRCPRTGSVSRPAKPSHLGGSSARGSLRSAPSACASLQSEGAAAARRQSPCPEVGNDTEFSHLIGLRQETPGDHWGGYRPLSRSSQRSRAPFKSSDELLLLERPPVMFRWQRGPEAAGLTPQEAARGGQAGGERPTCNKRAPITCTKRMRTAVVNGSLPA